MADSDNRQAAPIWWRLMDAKIGFTPVPVAVVLGATLIGLWATEKIPGEISVMIALLGLGGCVFGEIGGRIPLFNKIGGGVILTTFLPAYLGYAKVIPPTVVETMSTFWKTSTFVYLYITGIVVGSILGMDRTVLMRGFVKIFIPLVVGSLAAMVVGTGVAMLMGLEMKRAFFFIVIPIMSGGLGEGALPLTLGYSQILGQPQGPLLAQVLPPILLGNLIAIIFAGVLDLIGQRRPRWSGDGRLQDGAQIVPGSAAADAHPTVQDVAAAVMLAVTLYCLGLLAHQVIGLPAPVTMLFLAVALKVAHGVTPSLELGAHRMYRFFAVAVTYPLLFAIGAVLTPWQEMMAALSPASLATILATVLTLGGVGFAMGRMMSMYRIETALVNICHSGLGGTGDVAILTAAKRLQLMPFAQIATRLGGAITVTLTLIVYHYLNR